MTSLRSSKSAPMRMGLREANQGFSKLIAAVRDGKEIVLTERGKPLAVIKPLKRAANKKETIRRLEVEGVLRPALKRGPMSKWKPFRLRGRALSETLREERDKD